MQDLITKAKSDFLNAKSRLLQVLDTVPEDRLNWSPAPTARTPIEQVAHIAGSMAEINKMLQGGTFGMPTTTEADESFRAWEKQFTTKAEVLDLLEQNSNAYLAWLDALTPETLEGKATLPFNLGQIPLTHALGIQPMHLTDHTSQLVYIQTCYGDRTWH